MSRSKKLINNSGIPQREIEIIARCIYPDIVAFFESEEGQREFDGRHSARKKKQKLKQAR